MADNASENKPSTQAENPDVKEKTEAKKETEEKAEDNPEKNSDRKRGHNNNNNNQNNNNRGRRNKKSKYDKKNHTWRGDGDGDQRGNRDKQIHAGSYAHPAMRKLFNITLPPHLLPPDKPPTSEDYEAEKKQQEPKNFSKKKVAFLLAYLGTGFAGFQSNEGQRTLQADFELAMMRSELISPLNFGYFHKYSWSTSGRTDKGVHACAQVCSAKIQLKPDQSLDDVRQLINSHLPDKFRVLDIVRCGRSFCAKTGRSRVRYQYMIPAFCFWERNEFRDLMLQVAPKNKAGRAPGTPLSEEERQQIKNRIKDYRVTQEQLDSLQQALEKYQGTHCFHNFTKGLTSKDANAMRYIVSFKVEEPMVFENGMQWVPTQVIGQSFLLHQIRKMISVALDSVRLNLPNLIPPMLDKKTRAISDLAPAQGLFLEMSFYDNYNKKIENQPDMEKLDWSVEGTVPYERWKEFRNQVLMEHVVNEENKEGNFIQYLYNHDLYFEVDASYKLSHDSKAGKSDPEESKSNNS
ncbi:pseudouridine(27/28) synthase [Seminavis robusta]|uniref:Pseudouridine(27/28) synthase n=1 Tax=Seminavis robusta TaxID=568900 RepID=A0A9N8DER3_9STRA|nr:pseudouridine(27/28) synthase [Seminavis robusta]|eukprot:Sro83_g044530.1 pseudouridine(27/28) synthase (519) ;mRNA; f:109614-111357